MKKWNMIIDVAECTNCQLCTLATMDEYVGNDWPGYAAPMPKHGHKWINILQKERGQLPMIDIAYVPTMCNHCDDAPCIKRKGGGAIRKRDDGIVLIDPEKAKGRKELVDACPYGHIWWNEELRCRRPGISMRISSIKAGSRRAGSNPARPARCARSRRGCRNGADGARAGARSHEAELGTRPRVYYRNLWRYSKCFIGGTVSAKANGVVDCVEGANVRLLKDGAVSPKRRPTITAISNSTGSTRIRAPMSSRSAAEGRAKKIVEAEARLQHQSRRNQVIGVLADPSTPLVFPQLGALYKRLRRWRRRCCAS